MEIRYEPNPGLSYHSSELKDPEKLKLFMKFHQNIWTNSTIWQDGNRLYRQIGDEKPFLWKII